MNVEQIKEMVLKENLSVEELRGLNSFIVSEITEARRRIARVKGKSLKIGDRVKYDGRKIKGKGEILEILKVNAVVKFDDDPYNQWRVNMSALEKIA